MQFNAPILPDNLTRMLKKPKAAFHGSFILSVFPLHFLHIFGRLLINTCVKKNGKQTGVKTIFYLFLYIP